MEPYVRQSRESDTVVSQWKVYSLDMQKMWKVQYCHPGHVQCVTALMLELSLPRFSKFTPTTGYRVCSAQFEGGKKTYMNRVPTIFPLRQQKVEKRRLLRRTKVI